MLVTFKTGKQSFVKKIKKLCNGFTRKVVINNFSKFA